MTVIELTNILQTVHFSCNFLPYYLLHVRSPPSSAAQRFACCFTRPPGRSVSAPQLRLNHNVADATQNKAHLVLANKSEAGTSRDALTPRNNRCSTHSDRHRETTHQQPSLISINDSSSSSSSSGNGDETLPSRTSDDNDVRRKCGCCACFTTTSLSTVLTDFTMIPAMIVPTSNSRDDEEIAVTGV